MDTVSNALLGEDLGRPGFDHIWGFKESENLWFDGSRKLATAIEPQIFRFLESPDVIKTRSAKVLAKQGV